jgi:hypothetical protein
MILNVSSLPMQPLLLVGLALLAYIAWSYLQSPLWRIPGPRLAAFTDLWRLRSLREGSTHLAQLRLHRRLGRAVRLGPNMVSLSDATLIPTLYSSTKPWLKVRKISAVLYGRGAAMGLSLDYGG